MENLLFKDNDQEFYFSKKDGVYVKKSNADTIDHYIGAVSTDFDNLLHQLLRVEEIENAAFDIIKTLIKNYDIDQDVEFKKQVSHLLSLITEN